MSACNRRTLRVRVSQVLSVCTVLMGTVACTSAALAEDWLHPDLRFLPVEEAFDRDDFDDADRQLTTLRAEAKRKKDTQLLGEITERTKEISRVSREFEKLQKQLKSAEIAPGSRKAAAAWGKFYCTQKADWNRALPLLAKGDDAAFSSTAAYDLMYSAAPDQRTEIGDRWWDLAVSLVDGPERIACQGRAREWYLRARPSADEALAATIDQRLKQIPLFPEKIVVWNTHNADSMDRGAEEILVSLFYQGKVVWKKSTPIAWKQTEPSFVMLRPPRVRIDQVRVDVTRRHFRSGGLGEVEVLVGRSNIAPSGSVDADNYYESLVRYRPQNVVDGDRSGNSGFWVTDNNVNGWVSLHFTNLPRN